MLACTVGGSYVPINDVPTVDGSQKAMMWQQNQYMGDSGIHSGATTQVRTVYLYSYFSWL